MTLTLHHSLAEYELIKELRQREKQSERSKEANDEETFEAQSLSEVGLRG